MGLCAKCLRPTTKNPHPDAGKPDALLTIGCAQECIPCLVTSRHEWSQRACKAEAQVARVGEALGLALARLEGYEEGSLSQDLRAALTPDVERAGAQVAALEAQIQQERVDAQAREAQLGEIIVGLEEHLKETEAQLLRLEEKLSRGLTVCAARTQTEDTGTEAPRV